MENVHIEKENLIKIVVELEWNMFSAVNASEPNSCQENKKTFQIMRWMSYSVLNEEILKSLLDNLNSAIDEGRNLMTEKYGRMERKIPPFKDSSSIQEIADTELVWMKEVAQKYPLTFQGDDEKFINYLKCELETYSDKSLELYSTFVKNSIEGGINLIEERYNNLFKKMGYESLTDKESQERHKEFWKNNTCRGC
jgi:hypothetical protein